MADLLQEAGDSRESVCRSSGVDGLRDAGADSLQSFIGRLPYSYRAGVSDSIIIIVQPGISQEDQMT